MGLFTDPFRAPPRMHVSSPVPTAGDEPNMTVLDTVPSALLESFIPGFGIVSKVFQALTGIDITTIVTIAFIVAAVSGAGHYVWRGLSRSFSYWFTSTITINSNDKLYEQVMYWQSRHDLKTSRSLNAKTSKRNEDVAEAKPAKRQEKYDYAEIESSVPPQFIPALGKHIFWFRRNLLFLSLEKIQQPGVLLMDYRGDKDSPQTIKLSCLGRSPDPIKQFLMECKRFDALSNRSKTTIRRSVPQQNVYWQRSLERPSRPMSTVYMDEQVKEDLLQDITEFIDPTSPRFYARRGIPYRRGYLFWGPPGTGKTSLSFALAGHFGFELYVVSLREPFMSEFKLTELFARLPAHCIVLLEDVDTAGLEKREDVSGTDKKDAAQAENSGVKMREESRQIGNATVTTKAPEGITLSGLLNAVDGVASHEGRILILTTNSPESLDKALIRPGRVDMQIGFGLASKKHATQIFKTMYTVDEEPLNEADTLSSEELLAAAQERKTTIEASQTSVDKLATEFADLVPDLTFTPAEIQGFLLTRKKSPQKAVDEAAGWRDGLLAARASGTNIIPSEKRSEQAVASEDEAADGGEKTTNTA